ncbi:MAG: Hsp33 family molecular chaperone HslO [Firmicutes bacterium]|nr:Hsp33 family molecular chaperone HslO [Bacillota bacterium]
MIDYIVRAMAADNQIRAFAATTKNLVERARQIHHTTPVATAALGRLLTVGSMMGVMMKNPHDVLTLQIKCSGPLQGLLVTADAHANVKGYVQQPHVELPLKANGKLDVGKAVGKGVLSVIKDLGLKEPYIGRTELVSGEIAEDFTYYFTHSEQMPSAVALGVLIDTDYTVKQAGGFIIQVLPGCAESVIRLVEDKISKMAAVTSLLERKLSPEAILEHVLGEVGVKFQGQIPTQYACNCTKERVEKAIISIGKKEIENMIADKEPIEINCHFCNTNYILTPKELEKLLETATNA